MEPIVHLCKLEDWQAAQAAGEDRASSLATEGFIHCSRPAQVNAVANRYFGGIGDLLLLWIDPTKLTAELRWEPASGELYPHLYGPLALAAIFAVQNYSPDRDGVFRAAPEWPLFAPDSGANPPA